MDIQEQIQLAFERPDFVELMLQFRNKKKVIVANYEGILDGSVLKNLATELESEEDVFIATFFAYTDGISIFKKSKFSLTPFCLVFNELPPEKRVNLENVIMAGLWFGTKKPNFDLFLTHIKDQVKNMECGVQMRMVNSEVPVKVKGYVIGMMGDIPALAQSSNMKQHNGDFGCHFCYLKGENCNKTHVYRYFEKLFLRSEIETTEFALEAQRTKKAKFGIKKPSTLADIIFKGRYITNTAIDYMHNICEGNLKHILDLFFGKKHAKKPYSLRRFLQLIDRRIAAMTPPSSIQRLPRGIKEHFKYWKANECKAWLFYYSLPILADLLPPKYFELYKLFVYACALLCGDSISPSQVRKAERAFKQYEKGFEKFYGLKQKRMNVHLLRHLADNVRKFGSLYTTACFDLEDYLGKITRRIHGSKTPQLQVLRAMSVYLNYCRMKRLHLVKGTAVYDIARKGANRQMKTHQVALNTYIVGTYIVADNNSLPREVVTALSGRNIIGSRYCTFSRLLHNKLLFMSTSYTRTTATNSTYASYLKNGTVEIGVIQSFVKVFNCNCDKAVVCDCSFNIYAMMKKCEIKEAFFTELADDYVPHIFEELLISDEIQAVPVGNLKAVCFSVVLSAESRFVAEPINLQERE